MPVAFFPLCFRCSSRSVPSLTRYIRFCTFRRFSDCHLIPFDSCSISVPSPVRPMLPRRDRRSVTPLAPDAFTPFSATMRSSDFWRAFKSSPFSRLQSLLPFRLAAHGTRQTSQVCLFDLCVLATLSDPGGTCSDLAYRSAHCCLLSKEKHRLPLCITYGAESLHARALRLLRSIAYA